MPEVAIVRDRLEGWYANYPADAKKIGFLGETAPSRLISRTLLEYAGCIYSPSMRYLSVMYLSAASTNAVIAA